MKKIKQLFLLLLVTTFFVSCTDIDDNLNNNSSNSFTENFGNQVSRDFMGEIVDENNNPIQNVIVTIGTSAVQTDENGIFIIKNAFVYEKLAYIKANKVGFINGSRTLVPTTGMNQVKIMMIASIPVAIVHSGQNSEVTLPNQTKINFDGAFEDESGNLYSGDVSIFAYHLETSNEDLMDLMPGMLYAEALDGSAKVLETFGMLHVELKGNIGQKLQIAAEHTAQIAMKIDVTQTSSAENTIPLWHFDEVNGYWKEEGEASKQGDYYVGNVSHFSWWNCDQFLTRTFLNLTIKDNNNNPLSYSNVSIQRANTSVSFSQLTDVNGFTRGYVPANENLNAVLIDACENLIYLPIGTLSANSINNVNLIYTPNGSANLVTVEGNLKDCNSVNVTSGYVVLEYGNYHKRYVPTDANGDFTINSMYCLPDLNYTLTGFDFSSLQTTGQINYIYPLNTMVVNVGNLMTCNAISEFISYQIDNDATIYHLGNIDVSYSPNGLSISTFNNSVQSGILIWCNSNTLGNQITFSIEGSDVGLIDQSSTSIIFTLNSFGNVGDFIDVSFYGSYQSIIDNQTHTITGIAHVIRDN
ncbi:hypothetical protein [Flavobacterium sp.]|uniref:hypothetical protein n=2 Tax=Flavobacterium sp. TaxID=239 RepID=UPI004047F330